MILEVIATNVEEAVIAAENGADRLELIAAMEEGGLTPEMDAVRQVIDAINIPVNVMVRPHSRSFCYTNEEVLGMIENIQAIRETGANGIVTGALHQDGTVDTETLQKLVTAAEGMEVTFHRAFDVTESQERALEKILQFRQITRILTSGGARHAPEAVEQIKKLVKLTEKGACTILAGSGLTLENAVPFIVAAGVKEIHVGSGVRYAGDGKRPIDPERLRQLADRISTFGK